MNEKKRLNMAIELLKRAQSKLGNNVSVNSGPNPLIIHDNTLISDIGLFLEITEQDKQNELAMDEYAEECRKQRIKDRENKAEWEKKLKKLGISSQLFVWMDSENEAWAPEGIVEIGLVDEKISSYPRHQCARIKDDKDKLLYMRQDEDEIRGIDHVYVWQTTGILGDNYSGYLLFPLNDGKYFKVSYSC